MSNKPAYIKKMEEGVTKLDLHCYNDSYKIVFLLSCVMDNRIGDEGAKTIGEALKTNTTLTDIDIKGGNDSDNHIFMHLSLLSRTT